MRKDPWLGAAVAAIGLASLLTVPANATILDGCSTSRNLGHITTYSGFGVITWPNGQFRTQTIYTDRAPSADRPGGTCNIYEEGNYYHPGEMNPAQDGVRSNMSAQQLMRLIMESRPPGQLRIDKGAPIRAKERSSGGGVRGSIANGVGQNIASVDTDGTSFTEGSPAYLVYDYMVPDLEELEFYFVAPKVGEGDWFSIYFNSTLMWSIDFADLEEGVVYVGSFNTSFYRGTKVLADFHLFSNGVADSELHIIDTFSNLRAVSSVPAPGAAIVLVPALLFVALSRSLAKRGLVP